MLLIAFLIVLEFSFCQQAGYQKPENHPTLIMSTCTNAGGCKPELKSVVIDANWRWLHNVGGYTNCYTGTDWNRQFCPDPKTCAQRCALDGADYEGIYGIHTVDSGNGLKLDFVTGSNIGSRVYLLDSEDEYFLFKLKNREFSFDVDVTQLPCGINGALYMIEMDADGGTGRFPGNKAGAKYGTGYCDAQCPHDIKFINGEANILNWNDTTATGHYGTCCAEMDIWESNSISTAYTSHVCTSSHQTRCEGTACGDGPDRHNGWCDKDGCDLNPFRCGDKTFFGPGSNHSVDTTRVLTVITSWVTTDGTDQGDLKEIRRTWMQDGNVIQSRAVDIGGQKFDSVSDDFCNAQKKAFGDPNDYEARGGNKRMGQALESGMVLALSLWDDHAAYMLWLDSDYPLDKSPSAPGVARGSCSTQSGRPWIVEKEHANAYVIYSNIKYGEIGSTYKL